MVYRFMTKSTYAQKQKKKQMNSAFIAVLHHNQYGVNTLNTLTSQQARNGS